MWLVGMGCSTAAGAGTDVFWQALSKGKTAPVPLSETGLIKHRDAALPAYKVHIRKDLSPHMTHRQRLAQKLSDAWQDMNRAPSTRFGVIFASTKGFIEDVVWDEASVTADTLTPILEDFLTMTKLKPLRRAVVSNACSSVAAALKLAESWMAVRAVEEVMIVSADTVGEFVVRGFHSLSALTPQALATPFDQNRSGLQLGEAAAILLLSSHPESALKLQSVGVNCEGVAATRPDEEGRSLYLALSQALRSSPKPKAIVAHGTGTALNDSTEDFVFQAVYSGASQPLITGSKWCTGHTLGVSAALDLIAASQILNRQLIYGLANTASVDSKFKGQYVLETQAYLGESVLVSSLGFGGVHAGLLLERNPL